AATADAPITVAAALDHYETDLKARNAQIKNARWPKVHLTAALMAKPVMLLGVGELKTWRDGLLEKIKPTTVNRLTSVICAAFEIAAQHDARVVNANAWRNGLAGLPDASRARNVILSDAKVRAFVAATYQHDAALGLLADVLSVTGARASQATRLTVED